MRPLAIHWCIPHCCLTKFTPPTHEREVDWIICPVTKKLKPAYWILCLSNPIPFNSQLILSSYNWVYDFTYFGWSAALQITLCHSLVHPHCCLTKFTSPPPWGGSRFDTRHYAVYEEARASRGCIMILEMFVQSDSQLNSVDNKELHWVYDFTCFGWSAALQITLCHSLVHPHCCLTKFTSPPPWGGSRFDTRHYAVYEEARASRGCIMILEMFVQSDSQLNSVDNKTLSIRLYMLWLERSIANNSLSFTGPRCCLTKFTSPPLPWGGSRFDTRHYAV